MNCIVMTGRIYIAIRALKAPPLSVVYEALAATAQTSDPSGVSTLSTYKLAHWMVIVLRGGADVGIGPHEKFELLDRGGDVGVQMVSIPDAVWDEASIAACRGVCVGNTAMAFADIKAICNNLQSEWGPYHLLKNNCQDFAVKLINSLCPEHSFGWLSVACPQYRTRFTFFIAPHRLSEHTDGDLPTRFAENVRHQHYAGVDPEIHAIYRFRDGATNSRFTDFLDVQPGLLLQNLQPTFTPGWWVGQASYTKEWGYISAAEVIRVETHQE
ncbi:hypothetical protein B0H10DRAFT_2128985 [Mycena sp. CBHHK59/15]|nr:hypothetical protein B0H10DRAFT_2128985 [Mycena sp. CBHHK59/15]